MYWANFLHIYQPPTQKPHWVKKIAAESYRKIVEGLLANPTARLTLNINAVLVDLLKRDGCFDVVLNLKKLAERGQIEFTDSAKYHAFLPLLPEAEIERQIVLNRVANRRYFGKSYRPTGLFPTEMGYNRKVAKVAARLGYRWLILDELAHSGKVGALDGQTIYQVAGQPKLNVYFRERATSFKILSAQVGVAVFSAQMLVDLLGERVNRKEYLITAMDGETFGHHRPGLEDLLFDLYRTKAIESCTISELPDRFPKRATVEPLPSSWALLAHDIERNTPFSRWYSPKNSIQTMQWELTNLAIKAVKRTNPKRADFTALRIALDRSLHSDQYWWASAQPWWSLEMIEAGGHELLDVVLRARSMSAQAKARARKLYETIIFTGFEWQKTGKVEVLARAADEDVTQRITTQMPYIPRAEFDRIVGNLERQMLTAAKAREYERAAQIRDRVNELLEKKDQLTKR